jgi:hypothetical protein
MWNSARACVVAHASVQTSIHADPQLLLISEQTEKLQALAAFADVPFESQLLCLRQGRATLTKEQAKFIFQCRLTPWSTDRGRAGILARVYGVTAKTVRDIWVGRTWYRATFNLDPFIPYAQERLEKKAGRPKGAKDSKPRTRKLRVCRVPAHPDSDSDSGAVRRSDDDQHWSRIAVRSTTNIKKKHDWHPVPATYEECSWMDFPVGDLAKEFEDPFREDWESCRDWQLASENGAADSHALGNRQDDG